jgi:hypothetical protein
MPGDIAIGRVPDTQVDDLLIVGGDFAMTDLKDQDVYLLIRLHQGNVKQYPLAGYGEERMLNGPFDGATRKAIQEQLEADGIRVRQFSQSDQTIHIDFT